MRNPLKSSQRRTEANDRRTQERIEHTPGPWYCGEAQIKSSRRVFMPDDTVEIRGGEQNSLIACLYKTNFPQDGMDEANARLIAAAPALLAAAKKTKAFIDDLGRGNPGFLGKLVLQDYQQFNEAMMELPAAILLAEGKS